MEIRAEPFNAPDSEALRVELKAELVERYGGDSEPGKPASAEDVAAFLVARDGGGAAVGCGGLRALDDGAAEVKRMYVRPSARGRGLGWTILGALEAEARRLGFSSLRLETGDFLPEALSLYQAAGYREIPCWGDYVDGPASRCFERRL